MGQRVVVGVGLLVVALVLTGSAGIASGDANNVTSRPTIEGAYPNPIASGDAGEYVVVSLPVNSTLDNATLTDGTTRIALSNISKRGAVVISPDPTAARKRTDRTVANLTGFELANSGETLRIEIDGERTDQLRYRDAPEGKIAVVEAGRVRWRTLGATDFQVATAGPGSVRAFVLPDNPDLPAEGLRGATQRILLGGYTLSSERIASTLIRAHQRGVEVQVLLEGDPVGGRTRAEARQLDRLTEAGIDVAVVAGPRARVDYHHAKYAVVDDRALVMTENWKPAGTGGNASRGWGVVTEQGPIVDNLTATFAADRGWRDSRDWEAFRAGKTYERGESAMGTYPTNFEAATVAVNRTELLRTPDNGGDRLVGELDDAEHSIDVVQASLGAWDGRFPTALRRAAQRGVDVRILLSSAWYSKEENRAAVHRFREWASRTNAGLSIKLARPDGRFEKIHAKGAIVDDETVLVGSLNWNDAAATSNREVMLLLHGREVAAYYGDVFEADWTAGQHPALPVGVIAAVVGCLLLAGAVLGKIRFSESASGVGPAAGGDRSPGK